MQKRIKIRALEPTDLEFLYELENDSDLWYLGNQHQPMSRYLLMKYIQEADKDIYEAGQFRFAIEKTDTNELLGLIDLFDFDPKNKRAGVGIIIKNTNNRKQGFGKEALKELINYGFNILHLHQLYANISKDNLISISLFESLGFEKTGCKKDWNFNGKDFDDVLFYQLINK